MEDKRYLVYKHTSPSGKSYIGRTNNLTSRNWKHRNESGCVLFYNAIQKYGWDSFTHEVLDIDLTKSEADELEKRYIIEYCSLHPHGYNLTSGGEGGEHTKETKEKISRNNARRGKPAHNRGKPTSQAIKDKISQAKKGIALSDDTKIKMSNAKKGIPKSPESIAKRTATRLANRSKNS